MRSMITALVCGALLLTASVGAAQEDEADESPFAREGGYIGLSAVFAFDTGMENALEKKSSVITADVKTGWGLSARAGWRHFPYVATELLLEVIVDWDLEVNGRRNEIRNIAGSYNLKVPFLTHRWQPYATAGMGVLYQKQAGTTKDDSTNFMLRSGLGMDVYVTEHWVLNTEAVYVYPTGSGSPARGVGSINRLDYVSLAVGFAYRF